MKKLIFVIPTLTLGGAEKVTVQNAVGLAERGYDVSIVVPRGKQFIYVSPLVKTYIGTSKGMLSDIIYCSKIIKSIKPDFIFGVMERANFLISLLSLFFNYTPIHMIHTVPSSGYSRRGLIHRVTIYLTFIFARLNKVTVTCLNDSIKYELIDRYTLKANSIAVVPNFFLEPKLSEAQLNLALHEESKIVITFLGRLNKIKGCDVFIDAISNIPIDDLRLYKFLVIGDGLESSSLKRQAAQLCSKADINFLGATSEPNRFLEATDYLVVPSYSEGFGMVVLEGLYNGCSILFSNCNYGPKDILTTDFISYSNHSFADPSVDRIKSILELTNLLLNSTEKKTLKDLDCIRAKIFEKYSYSTVLSKLENLLNVDSK